MDYSSPGSSVQRIIQARILEWVAVSFSRESSGSGDQTQVSCIAGKFFTAWFTREAPMNMKECAKFRDPVTREHALRL